MSDTPKKRESNFDLDRAEQKLIAAGHPELADAFYDYAQGIRNFVQGDFGQSFVDAYESVLVKHVAPLTQSDQESARILGQVLQSLDQQRDLVQQILTAHKETVRGLKKANARISDVDKRHGQQWKEAMALLIESKNDRADLRQRIDALGQTMTSREEHARLVEAHEALVRRVIELEGKRGDVQSE